MWTLPLFKNIRAEKGNYPNAEIFVYYEYLRGQKGLFAQSGQENLEPKIQQYLPIG